MEAYLLDVLGRTAWQVANTLLKNWPYLLVGVLATAFLRVNIKPDTISSWLRRRTGLSVLLVTLLGACTPL